MSIVKQITHKQRPQTAYTLSQKDLNSGKYNINDQKQINKLLDKNTDYFEHMNDKCICGMCICGGCKCNQKSLQEQQGIPTQSVYQSDFIQKQSQQVKSVQQLPSYQDEYKMKFETTQRLDFKEPKQRPQTAFKPYQPRFTQPFHAGSTYQLTHIPMPELEKVNIIPQNYPTVMKDLEFLGQSEYKRNFSGTPNNREKRLIFGAHSSFGNPINPGLPFFGTSTSQRAFRPFKSKPTKQDSKNNDTQNIPSFFGQYTSTTKQDYMNKQLMICPAKIILNQRKSQKFGY